jgi:hypothetical protein
MKKLQLLVVAFLFLLSICLLASSQVVKAAGSPTVSVPTLSPISPITLGGSVTAKVIVGGVGGTPTGTITFQYSTNSGSTWTQLGTVITLSKGSATSDSYTPNAVGSNYRIRAVYSGDTKFDGATGNAASLTVNKANPTVPAPTLNPTSPIYLGGSVTAAVTISGVSAITPTGTITFQYSTNSGSTWTQLGTVITLSKGSATSDSYTPNALGSNYRIRAVYSGDNNYNAITGNAASLTVNKANPTVPAPLVDPNSVVVNNTVTVSVTISGFSDGATPTGTATFQVKIGTGSWTTIGSAVSLSSSSASTTYIPPTVGSYQFRVVYNGDSNYNGATGSAVSVTVNFPPPHHFEFSSFGTQAAGTSFNIIITAKDASNNTLPNYIGANTLNVSTGTVSPTVTGLFSSGVWVGSVTVTGAGSGVTLFTTGSGVSGTSNIFTVNSGALEHFTFAPISSPQTAGSAFSITVTAKDVYGNTVAGYVSSPSLIYSAGSISPSTIDAFISGVGSTSVTVTAPGSNVNITVSYENRTGVSNLFAVTNSPPPTPEPTPTVTPTPTSMPTSTPTSMPTSTPTSMPTSTPTSTSTPKVTPTPTAEPSPSPTPLETTVKATIDTDAIVDLTIKGNITSTQMSNVIIATNQSSVTTVTFTVTGQSGTTGYSNITIPKTLISNGTTPTVFIENQKATNQGYTQDLENFYIWYTTQFSTHQINIQFTKTLTTQTESTVTTLTMIGLFVPEIVLIYTVIAVKRLKRKPEET